MLTDEQIGHSLERYHPCRTGLHVCSVDEEANEPITVANFPFPDDASAADAFCSTGEEFSADEALGEPPDLVVDLMSDGSILGKFQHDATNARAVRHILAHSRCAKATEHRVMTNTRCRAACVKRIGMVRYISRVLEPTNKFGSI